MSLNYVTFDEALKASVDGKEVRSWLENETLPYNIHRHRYDDLNGKIKIYKFELLGKEMEIFNELKWTVSDK